jgi:predicted acylesterase/phospholipase RssA
MSHSNLEISNEGDIISKRNSTDDFYTSPIKFIKQLFELVVYIKKRFDIWLDKKERKLVIKKLIEECADFNEWKKLAIELDILEGKDKWKSTKETTLYDYREVEKLIIVLKKKREMKDISGLAHYIRVNLMKNLYSTFNPSLFSYCNYGTKYLIEEFEEEMIRSLDFIANFSERNFPLPKKLEFFSETRHSYGRTALLLSGGANLGMFHIGVVKTLYERGVLPRIICGSSAGSIIAALLCTTPYEKLAELFKREIKMGLFSYKDSKYSFWRKIFRYLTRGVLLDVEVLKDFIRENIGDLTFQEAFDLTGWILNITVTGYKEHDNHRLLNYLTTPNVIIWSACCASSCVPGVFDPVTLMCKNEYGHIIPYYSHKRKFIDGTISADLPMARLAELFNVNIFIVSQTNPWVIPFLDQDDNKELFNMEKKKFNLWKIIKNLIFSEIKHRCLQIESLGILPSFLTRWFNLITQEYRGHVTIFPIPKLADYLKIFTNPSKEHIDYCTQHSSKRTFPSNFF